MELRIDERMALRRRFVLLLLVLLLAFFLYLVSAMLLGVIAGMLLWTMTRPLFEWFRKKSGGRESLSAFLSVVITGLVVIIPIVVIVMIMVADAAALASEANRWIEPHSDHIRHTVSRFTSGESIRVFNYELSLADVMAKVEDSATQIGQFLMNLLQRAAGGVAQAVLLLLVTLYTLYFFYKDGTKFFAWLEKVLPLDPDQSRQLISDFFATSKATLKTVGIIGAVQGSMGGLAFWICGIPSPFLWTMVMAVASVIPVVGVQIVMVPAALLLILIGKTGYGIGMFLWSWIAIANVDNFLRPYLVRREVNLHEMLVFLSTIGGIATFGFFGFLIGPVIAAMLKASFRIYETVYKMN